MRVNCSLTELIAYSALLKRLGWGARTRRPDLWEAGLARIFGTYLARRMMAGAYELVYAPALDADPRLDRFTLRPMPPDPPPPPAKRKPPGSRRSL